LLVRGGRSWLKSRCSDQTKLAQAIDRAFWQNDVLALTGKAPATPFDPFVNKAPHSAFILYSASLLPVYPSVLSVVDGRLASTLLAQTTLSGPTSVQTASNHLLASLVNKLGPAILPDLDNYWQQYIAESTTPLEDRTHAVVALAWVARGLIVKSDAAGYALSDKLLGLCADEALGPTAARAIEVIGSEDPWLTKQNHANVKVGA
jgi:DNA repair/transcription protein MET18/MMS19